MFRISLCAILVPHSSSRRAAPLTSSVALLSSSLLSRGAVSLLKTKIAWHYVSLGHSSSKLRLRI